MNTFIRTLAAAVAIVTTAAAGASTDEVFDLSSQRGEVQQFNRVPGHKVDHKGLVINPTPHSLTLGEGKGLPLEAGYNVNDRQKAFAGDLGFLKVLPKKQKGVKLDIDFGAKQAEKAGVKPLSGAYQLTIDSKGVHITGYDERGAFYALQTLRQVMQSEMAAATGTLPLLSINDFPSLPYRGVVEGFYGTPWSHEVRLSLIDFYGRNKMNNYLYGPKDDPYHSSPNWRLPYPEDQARNIHELVEASKRNRVDFIWAIHPGKDIRWNKADYDSLVAKFNMMYDLGVRHFAIFFDDIDGEGTNPHRQVELLNNLTDDFVRSKGDVGNLIVCPTDYSQLWAKPGPDGPLAVYGKSLNPLVEVFWTGAVVCSDLTPETLDFINSRIKRPALYWWNYPVTDYCRHIVMQGPVYGLDTNLTSAEVAGVESNPMEHGEASKLALYGVADYAWNVPAYNPIDNWERGLVELMPTGSDAYRTFAIHSTDTETGYRRDESWETVTFPYNKYTPEQFDALREEFTRVAAVPARMEAECTNQLLMGELRPWLKEFGRLGERGLRTMDLIKTFENGTDSAFWTAYTANLMTADDRRAYEAHKSGTMKLQPFYDNAMDQMVMDYYHKLTGKAPMMPVAVGTFPNLSTTLPKIMLDNDTTTHYTSGQSQASGDWIGFDIGAVRPVSEVIVHQGRNSVDDGDYFEEAILEASADGRTWKALTDSLHGVYVVKYKGEPVDARYVRLRRLDSPRQSWATVRTFRINPPSAERIGLNLAATDLDGALLMLDENPTSSAPLKGSVRFDRPAGAEALTFLASPDTEITLSQYDAKGKDLGTVTVVGAWNRLALDPATARLELDGTGTIYEIIP